MSVSIIIMCKSYCSNKKISLFYLKNLQFYFKVILLIKYYIC